VFRGARFKGHGRLWEWCSTCRTFEHFRDGFVPEWWVEPYSVERQLLRYDPEPIESARKLAAARIDGNAGEDDDSRPA
jgi:hypothetical protein